MQTNIYNKLYQKYLNLFYLSGCKVHAFGSIVTGLGIKSSDVDCYISLPTWLQNSGDTYVGKAKSALRRRSNIFKELFVISRAKVPIVKFYHAPTKRHCDISFKSSAGIENSKLLSYLLALDKRVLPLAVIIKYWAKVHHFTGTNLMPNYALILLVIFYLQQKAILPPIYHLQRNVEQYVDYWNVGFQDVIHLSGNNESLYSLLGGFFEYYSSFNYDLFIVCPFLGRPIKKELFEKLETVPPEYELYKHNIERQFCQPFRLDCIICIQDPFEHNKNCTVAMYPRLVQKVSSLIKSCGEIFAKKHSELFLKEILSVVVEGVPVSSKNKTMPNRVTKSKLTFNRKKITKNIQKIVSQSKHKYQNKS